VLVGLKRAYPGASIDWLVQDTFAPAVACHPDLGQVVPFPRRAFSRWMSPKTWSAIRGFLRDLRQRDYQLVVECQGLARSGFFAWATRALRRVGLANAAELGWLGLTERVDAPLELHAVERMMRVARAAGASGGARGCEPPYDLRLYTSEQDRHAVRTELAGGVLEPGSYVLLAPTTRWPAKLWPGEKFAELARRLLDSGLTGRIAFVGAAHERAQCAALEALASKDPRVVDLVGKTSIGQLMAVVEGAALVVASDSAALHMAVGFDRPLVGLFGPTDVSRVGPYGREKDVIQHVTPADRLDHKDAALGRLLMERIGVEEVVAAAKRRL
jgi:heptosyltransferase-1/heptosyltransferase-2